MAEILGGLNQPRVWLPAQPAVVEQLWERLMAAELRAARLEEALRAAREATPSGYLSLAAIIDGGLKRGAR